MAAPPRPLTKDDRERLVELLADWLPRRRWFAGKGHALTAVRLLREAPLPGPVGVEHLVVGVQLDGTVWQAYQVPVSRHPRPLPGQEAIGLLPDGSWVHDALTDPVAAGRLLDTARREPVVDPDATHAGQRDPELQAVVDPAGYRNLPARPLSVEQSNTSVRFGDVALLKVFRLLVPGINPDVEVHAALQRTGCRYVGACLGWLNGGWPDPDGHWVTGHLGMVQELLAPAVDGWALALDAVATGTSFAPDARALGEATGAVHRDLREVLPTRELRGAELAALADRLHGRLDRAASVVEPLGELAPALHGRIGRLAGTDRPVTVQRVHGDYHLGQVLRAASGWKLLDFEGEPGAPIPARVVPDHPLRDVAGMLRSFAYAAAQGGAGRSPEEVAGWRDACAARFLDGYATTGAADPRDDGDILTAYLVDKAAYEAVYEFRNRPDWLSIPMSALAELAGR